METTSSADMTVAPNDESCPSITIIRSSNPYTGEKLSKAKGNYHQWYEDMLIHMMGNCLFDYIEGDAPAPSATIEPHARTGLQTTVKPGLSLLEALIPANAPTSDSKVEEPLQPKLLVQI